MYGVPIRHLCTLLAMAPDSPGISLDDRFTIADDVVFREVGGEAVILDLKHGTYFGLDAIGTRVWQLLEEHGTLRGVIDTITAEYDVSPAQAQSDLFDLVNEMQRRDLLQRAE